MDETNEFDFCVVGVGSAGYAAAVTGRDLGKSVALVDGNDQLGGLCILRGCMPSKTLLRSAEIAHLVRHAPDYGINAAPPTVDFARVMDRKRRIIKEFADYRVDGIEKFPLFRGDAKFISNKEFSVDGRTLRARKWLVSTGSVIDVPDIPGMAATGFLTSDDVLELSALPESIIVLGGGPVAVELAQYLARLGVDVTIVQRSRTLLSYEDEDIGQSLQACFEREGIRVVTGTTLSRVDRVAARKRVWFEASGRMGEVVAEDILVALGRRARVDSLGLERAGIDYDRKGIKVDGQLRTTNPDVYAAGDVLYGSWQLVHVAVYEGQLAARNALTAAAVPLDYALQRSRAVFTDPQVAVAGLTERECEEQGIACVAATFPFKDLGKAIATNRTEGFIKIVAAPEGTMLGVAIVGADASDLIHEAIALLYFKADVRDVMMMPHLHPTLAEIITYPAEELCERLENEKRALVTP